MRGGAGLTASCESLRPDCLLQAPSLTTALTRGSLSGSFGRLVCPPSAGKLCHCLLTCADLRRVNLAKHLPYSVLALGLTFQQSHKRQAHGRTCGTCRGMQQTPQHLIAVPTVGLHRTWHVADALVAAGAHVLLAGPSGARSRLNCEASVAARET